MMSPVNTSFKTDRKHRINRKNHVRILISHLPLQSQTLLLLYFLNCKSEFLSVLESQGGLVSLQISMDTTCANSSVSVGLPRPSANSCFFLWGRLFLWPAPLPSFDVTKKQFFLVLGTLCGKNMSAWLPQPAEVHPLSMCVPLGCGSKAHHLVPCKQWEFISHCFRAGDSKLRHSRFGFCGGLLPCRWLSSHCNLTQQKELQDLPG